MRRKAAIKKFFSLFIIVLFSAFQPQNSFSKDIQIRVGSSTALYSAGIFIAYEKGYFKQEGLDIKLTIFEPGINVQLPLLASGKLDVAGTNITAGLFNAFLEGIPVKIVANKGMLLPGCSCSAFLVRKDIANQIKTVADLRGRLVAVVARGSDHEFLTEKALKKGGLSLRDVRTIVLGFADMNAAFANGSLDAAIEIEPFLTYAIDQKLAVKKLEGFSFYPYQEAGSILYSSSFVGGNPEGARKFMLAYLRGVRDYYNAFVKGDKQEKKQLLPILIKYTGINDPLLYERMKCAVNPDGFVNQQSLKQDEQWFYDHGYIKNLVKLDDVVDNSYVQYAVKKLGSYKVPRH